MRGRLAITTEDELLTRLQAGDQEAFACLVDRHHAAMVRIARSYVRSQAVAEEVAQEAWLGLLRGLDRFEGRSSLRTTDYLGGALSEDDRALVEAHLAECEACTEHLRQIRITVTVTGRVRDQDLNPRAREDLMNLYRRWQADREP